MRALTVIPGRADSGRLDEVGEPPVEDGPVLVETLAVGVCGTDTDILAGKYGWAPPGRERLILGHESLGRVLEAPGGSGLARGDLVVHTAAGDLVEHAPTLYQESNGIRQVISGRYDLGRDGQLGFEVGAYDHTRPLVIDPVASLSQPVRRLRGFQRVTLAPGEKKTVTFRLDASDVGFYDNSGKFVVEPGEIDVYAGDSSTASLEQSFTVR